MRRSLFLSAAILLLEVALAWAAPNTPISQKRTFYAKAYSLLSQYETAAGFFSEEDTRDLLRVFDRNRQASVFMDLMGHPAFGKEVTLGEYLDFVTKRGYTLNFEVTDVRRGDIRREGNLMILPVTFMKTVSYYDGNDVRFSPESYYRSPIELTAEFVYEPSTDKCYIRSVQGRYSSTVSPLPEKFIVIRRNRDDAKAALYDSLLVAANGISPFDAAGQVFYAGNADVIQTWDSDVLIKAENVPLKEKSDRYSLVQFRYRPVHHRLRFRAGMALAGAYSVESPDDFTSKSSAYEGSLVWGYAFPLGPLKVVPCVGLGMQFSSLSLNRQGISYSYAMTDAAGVLSERRYVIDDAFTALSFSDVFAPVYVDFEFSVGRIVNIHALAGVKAYLNMGTKIATPYTLKGSIDGRAFEQIPQAYLQPVSYERKRFDVSFVAGLDIDVSVIRNKLSISAGVCYEMGLMPSFSTDVTRWFDAQEQVYPLVYYASQETDVPYSSMMGNLKYTRKALWVHLGLFKKF